MAQPLDQACPWGEPCQMPASRHHLVDSTLVALQCILTEERVSCRLNEPSWEENIYRRALLFEESELVINGEMDTETWILNLFVTGRSLTGATSIDLVQVQSILQWTHSIKREG